MAVAVVQLGLDVELVSNDHRAGPHGNRGDDIDHHDRGDHDDRGSDDHGSDDDQYDQYDEYDDRAHGEDHRDTCDRAIGAGT